MVSQLAAISKLPANISYPALVSTKAVVSLADEHRTEVLSFLAERPLHTVFMSGYIRDHGLVSPLNRGTFYGCRDAEGRLEGVALIGDALLFETRSEAALAAFANLARSHARPQLILGDGEKVAPFWHYYTGDEQLSHKICRELLFELRWPVEVHKAVPGLRAATLDDLELIVPVHAQMAFEESGVNPLETDAVGFRERCARRIERGRVWVWVENNSLIFKADIVSETPETIYLEGIYVAPQERGKGYGLRCISQLGRSLLERTGSVCLLVNEQNKRAQALYRRANYKFRAFCDTIFLQ